MYQVRKFEAKDVDGVKAICLALADEEWKNNPLFAGALQDVFCRYYIEKEPENCFVAVDETDQIKGYVLGAKDFETYASDFVEDIVKKSQNPVTQAMGPSSMEAIAPFSKDYPAHLHIDLLPECQGQGVGRMLLDTLAKHFRKQGIPGLLLDVAKDNTGAIAFYEKCGFSQLHAGEQEIVMGRILQ